METEAPDRQVAEAHSLYVARHGRAAGSGHGVVTSRHGHRLRRAVTFPDKNTDPCYPSVSLVPEDRVLSSCLSRHPRISWPPGARQSSSTSIRFCTSHDPGEYAFDKLTIGMSTARRGGNRCGWNRVHKRGLSYQDEI